MGSWQEAVRSQTSRCINCFHSLKKEKEGKGKEKFTPEFFVFCVLFFPLNDEGCLIGGPLCRDGGKGGEITGDAWSLKLIRHSGLSYTFFLCCVGNE